MKKVLIFGLLTLLTASCNRQEASQGQDAEIEAQVAGTLSKLTLEEKIGQMT